MVLIALAAGLRKGEIDTLCWHQIDFERGLIRVEHTDTASLKSADSRGEVPIDASVVELLRGFRARATGPFVIEGGDGVAGPRMWGRNYRVQNVFDRVTAWLRKHGVTATAANSEKPLEVGNTAQLRDLAQSAARIFGWDSGRDKGRSGDTHNTLVVTTEQLQLMRQLCETPEEREYNRKMGNQMPPAPPVPIGYEVKVTP